jgi:hypothetical protein
MTNKIKSRYERYTTDFGFDCVVAVRLIALDLEHSGEIPNAGVNENFHKVGIDLFGEELWRQRLSRYVVSGSN